MPGSSGVERVWTSLLAIFLLMHVAGCAADEALPRIAWDAPIAGAGARAPVELAPGVILAVRTKPEGDTVSMVAARSDDCGATWTDVGIVATDARGTDLGDCHVTRLRDGRLWCSYRRNKLRGDAGPTYALEIAESVDDGRTWRRHSVVAESKPTTWRSPSRGLWSTFILERRDGSLQCYFDDEDTTYRAGFPRHQWLVMRTWDARSGAWVDPVVVSRAHNVKHLSRDGMASVVELPGPSGVAGRLIAVFESVHARPPHANLVRFVTSDDGGRTWSWSTVERGVVYEPSKPDDFMALAPWLIRLRDGMLLCLFCTDEDRDEPDVSGTPPRRMNLDIKCVTSRDDGRTWSRLASLVYAGTHRNYLPGVIELSPREGEPSSLVLQVLDHDRGYVLLRGHTIPRPTGD